MTAETTPGSTTSGPTTSGPTPDEPTVDELRTEVVDGVLTVTFARPARRNAMTWAMYEGLRSAALRAGRGDVRVVVLRGEGGRAFVAGTDIAQFAAFTSGHDGVDYERSVAAVLEDLLAIEVPVVAAVDGFCVGAGIAIAACADLVVATPDSSFGVPVARTLGNTLSAHSLALLVERLGRSRVSDLLLTARLMGAEEAHTAGFVARIVDDLDAGLDELVATLVGNAPLTQWATLELLRRLRGAHTVGTGDEAQRNSTIDDSDVIARVYGSEDFADGVAAFGEHRRPVWHGR